MWVWRGSSSAPSRFGPLSCSRWIETFWMPVAGLRAISRPGRDVGAAVVLVVRRQRQLAAEIDLAMHDLLRRRVRDFLPGQRIERGVLEARQHLARLDAHRVGDPLPVGDEPGDHRHRVSVRTRKQRRLHAVEPLGDGGKLELQRDVRPDHGEPVARRQMIEPVAQGRDRARRVAQPGGAVDRSWFRAGKRLVRLAQGGSPMLTMR